MYNCSVSTQIRVAAININSLVANYRKLELLQFLREHDHGCIFVSETKLNPIHKLVVADYNLVRNDRPNAIQGAGTAILIKKGIQFKEVYLPTNSSNEILEYSVVKILISGKNSLILISAYAKNDGRRVFIEELDNIFIRLKLFNRNVFYILARDLNARRKVWRDRANNPRGRYPGQWESTYI